jgi:O-antigen/teichoic acid export membrane protein
VGFVFSFAVPLILVRALDQSTFGQYKQYYLIATTAIQIGAVGLPWSLFYFLPAEGARRGRYVAGAMLLLSGLGLILLLLATAFGPELTRWMSAPALGQVMPLLGLYAALTLATQFAEDLAVIEQRPRTAAAVLSLSEATRASLLVGAVLTWGTIEAIAWASIVHALLRGVFLAVYAMHLYGRHLLEVRPSVFGELLRYAIPFGVAVVVETAQGYLHQFYVAGVSNPATFAIYAVGCLQVPVAHIVYSAIADVALVRATEYAKAGQSDAMVRLYRDVVRLLSAFFVPTYLFLAAFATAIIHVLFTASYLAAAPVLVVFATTLLLFPPADHVVLRAYAQTRFILAADLAGLAVTGLLLIPLHRTFGLAGVAAAYVAGAASVRALGLVRVRRLLGSPWTQFLPLRALGAVVVSAGVGAGAALAVTRSLSPLPKLLVGAAVLGGSYLLLAWRFGVVTPGERGRVLRLFLGRLAPGADVRR